MALPARPSRHLGLRPSVRADSGRHHGRRQAHQSIAAVPSKQGFLYVFDRQTGEPVWPIVGTARRKRHGAGRMVFADSAVPDQAAAVRASGRSGKGSDRLHARASGRGEEGGGEHQAGSALYAADRARAKAARSEPPTSQTARTGPEARTIRKRESCTCTRTR